MSEGDAPRERTLDGCQIYITNAPVDEDGAEMRAYALSKEVSVVALFSTDETRERFERDFPRLSKGTPKVVVDTREFLLSVASQGFEIALDLHLVPGTGDVRYDRVQSEELERYCREYRAVMKALDAVLEQEANRRALESTRMDSEEPCDVERLQRLVEG